MKNLLKKLGESTLFSPLIMSAAFFLVGAVAGGITAANAGDSAQVSAQVSAFTAIPDVGFAQAALSVFKYPVLALLLGLSLFGAVAIPILLMVRGFLFSFAVTAFARVFGLSGLGFVLALFLVQLLLVLPVLLLLSARGFVTGCELFCMVREGKKPLVFRRRYISTTLVCMAVLTLAALAECYLTPALAMFVQRFLT